jgi:hypothetical protein
MMKIVKSAKGNIAVIEGGTEIIKDTGSFLNLIISPGTEIVAIKREHLDPQFFNLKSRLAGELLQKVSNYRMRLIVLGDFSDITSRSLKDFILESNNTGHVVFATDLNEAIRILKK